MVDQFIQCHEHWGHWRCLTPQTDKGENHFLIPCHDDLDGSVVCRCLLNYHLHMITLTMKIDSLWIILYEKYTYPGPYSHPYSILFIIVMNIKFSRKFRNQFLHEIEVLLDIWYLITLFTQYLPFLMTQKHWNTFCIPMLWEASVLLLPVFVWRIWIA